MKNKRICKTLSALCLTMVVAFGFTIPAFAQGSEQAPAAPAEDSTNDSNVIVEETEPAPALTPEGNAALVDDFGGNKQLITVTTKAGNYFYILIDRANEDKETAAYISWKKELIEMEEYYEIRDMFVPFNLPISADDLDVAKIVALTKSDKKMRGGKIRFVL